MIHHVKGLSCKVHLHLLTDNGIEMKGLLVLLTPLGIVLAELPVRVEFQAAVPTALGIPVPEHGERHVLTGCHVLLHGLVVRHLVTEIPTRKSRRILVDRGCDTVVRDSLRKWIVQRGTGFESPQEVIDSRLADLERLSNLGATHTQGIVFCNDVLVIQHTLPS